MPDSSGVNPSPAEQRDAQDRDSFDRDLRPNSEAGQNSGVNSAPGDDDLIRAYDVKEVHDLLPDWNSDELKQLVFLMPGRKTEQGAAYFDLRNPGRGEFRADLPATVDANELIVPKSEMEFTLWNKLVGRDTVQE